MNEVELERAISKLKAKLLLEKGRENSASAETRKRLVRLQTQRIKLKELKEEEVRLPCAYRYYSDVLWLPCY